MRPWTQKSALIQPKTSLGKGLKNIYSKELRNSVQPARVGAAAAPVLLLLRREAPAGRGEGRRPARPARVAGDVAPVADAELRVQERPADLSNGVTTFRGCRSELSQDEHLRERLLLKFLYKLP